MTSAENSNVGGLPGALASPSAAIQTQHGSQVDPRHIVELQFAVQGHAIALDHGYPLYAALVAHIPELHGETLGWQVLPVRGRQLAPGRMGLLPSSCVGLRCPAATIPAALGLAGKTLRIGEDLVTLGVPVIRPLAPAVDLLSRFVTIKGFEDTEPFREALIRQLLALAGEGDGAVAEIGERRVMRVATHTIVGFAVALRGLSDEASLLVQARGLGGRRRMGAGVFFREGRKAC